MYTVKADPDRQRMEIVIDAAMHGDDFQRLFEMIAKDAASLKPGWVAAVDLRGMWVDDPFINTHFQALQETLLTCQAGRIGTLLDSDPIKMRLLQAGERTHSNVITRRFYAEKEWNAFLSQGK